MNHLPKIRQIALAFLTFLAFHATAATYYVDINSPAPTPPYASLSTAATNIQSAIDLATSGDLVLVNDGVYATGGEPVSGYGLTNRVLIDKPITVESLDGPAVTTIEGLPVVGENGIRCVYLTNNAVLIGFTLTNGAALGNGDLVYEQSGGGALCESDSAVLSNCVITANSASVAGGGVYQGTMLNCVISSNSVIYYGNGDGGGADTAILVDCVVSNNLSYVGGGAENSALLNCTLTGNTTYIDSDYTANGGGAANCELTNCIITGNSCLTGAGASSCTLVNCALTLNSTLPGDGSWPPDGGGAYGSDLINCTVIDNNAVNTGGGVDACTLTNCIVYFNSAPNGSNYSDDSALSYCDSTPLATNGDNNVAGDPLFADWVHISPTSPCRGAGDFAATSGTDIDGDTWSNPPSIGCDEFNTASATGALTVVISATFTNVSTLFNVNFAGVISGHATANRWDFGDGTVVSNELTWAHSWNVPGNYTVTFTVFNTDNPDGVALTLPVSVLQNPVHYVWAGGTDPEPPYLTWATAATNIQDAVNAAYANGTVIVSNGVYQSGQFVLYGTTTNRVAVTKPLTLESVNGAAATVIDGGGIMGCLYLTNDVTITGFTLQNGNAPNGGGAFCDNNDVLNGCLLTNNSSSVGGGADGGTLNHCMLVGNYASVWGGGAVGATLNFCVLSNNSMPSYGGATVYCNLNNCLVANNAAAWGGGADSSTLANCLCINNWAAYAGGGTIWSTVNNCTVVSNAVATGPGTYGGGGVYDGPINNSIVYNNAGGNYSSDFYGVPFNNSCTWPDPGGFGNVTNDPDFVDPINGDYHLQPNSPCINAGNNSYVAGSVDFDSNPRIAGGTADIGAYEYQTPTSVISYAYLQQYGLPADGSVDFANLDGTAFNVYQDWAAGLNPTNSSSVLAMLTPTNTASGITVTWQSVSGITYFLQSSTNLAAQPAFITIQTNIIGQAGTTSYIDTTATNNNTSYFYRVGVVAP